MSIGRAAAKTADHKEILMTKKLLAMALAASIALPVAAFATDAAPQRAASWCSAKARPR